MFDNEDREMTSVVRDYLPGETSSNKQIITMNCCYNGACLRKSGKAYFLSMHKTAIGLLFVHNNEKNYAFLNANGLSVQPVAKRVLVNTANYECARLYFRRQ
jgi:hypothetical protein